MWDHRAPGRGGIFCLNYSHHVAFSVSQNTLFVASFHSSLPGFEQQCHFLNPSLLLLCTFQGSTPGCWPWHCPEQSATARGPFCSAPRWPHALGLLSSPFLRFCTLQALTLPTLHFLTTTLFCLPPPRTSPNLTVYKVLSNLPFHLSHRSSHSPKVSHSLHR